MMGHIYWKICSKHPKNHAFTEYITNKYKKLMVYLTKNGFILEKHQITVVKNNVSMFFKTFTETFLLLLFKRIVFFYPAGMDASQMHLWDVSYIVSGTSQRELICKSLRRLPGNWLKTSPQRHLWVLSAFLRDVFELHLRDCNSWPLN